ncbi:MAG: HAD-IIB family hydrolase [Polyangiaceae bacterium]|nr:HAD-IIB family hydrolase [Polyangiaceae bacterium]
MTKSPRPLSALSNAEAKRLTGLVFDLDDTVLDHGALTEEAYSALFRMREAGLRLVACTGRPAGWAEVLLRQWPIDAAVAENGAVGLVKRTQHAGASRIETMFPTNPDAMRAEREELLRLAHELVVRFPEAALADDNAARWTDVTIDIGEHRSVGAEVIAAMRSDARSRGVVTFVSSVHLHLSFTAGDKASGTLRLLQARFGESSETACSANAFVGDSGNDASAFSVFQTTFGVSNVTKYLSSLPDPPKFVMKNAMGAGFAELAKHLVALRGSASS